MICTEMIMMSNNKAPNSGTGRLYDCKLLCS